MLLISPILSQEAVLSSKLEGTHATLEDLLNYQAGNYVEVQQDEIKEIQNYREALTYALNTLSIIDEDNNDSKKLPLSTRIIKEMHKILLDNVRGSTKRPGEFKRNQNYIGTRNEILFTPVPPELTNEYMSNLENYIHMDEISLIIQSAIIHAQFEMIHPFEDGNGRIGRLLIPLFLYYRKALPIPTFYMSSFFEKDRSLYISNLSNISKNNDWESWIKYYLTGVIISADENSIKAKDIFELYNYLKDEKMIQLNTKNYIKILDFLFQYPIFTVPQISKKLDIPNRTIYRYLNKLVELDILNTSDSDRNKTYYFLSLLRIII